MSRSFFKKKKKICLWIYHEKQWKQNFWRSTSLFRHRWAGTSQHGELGRSNTTSKRWGFSSLVAWFQRYWQCQWHRHAIPAKTLHLVQHHKLPMPSIPNCSSYEKAMLFRRRICWEIRWPTTQLSFLIIVPFTSIVATTVNYKFSFKIDQVYCSIQPW